MTHQQILHELEHLTTSELLEVIEAATHRVKMEIALPSKTVPPQTMEEQLKLAAEALWQDYANDEELRVFTALDAQEFVHAPG